MYFSEGAPIGYVWWALPTRLRAGGMPVDEVAALIAMLTLPWAFKFVWAPAVDRLRGPRWDYRAWIVVAQLAMGLTLLPLGFVPVAELGSIVSWLLLAHAFSAATQDVAIDALAISTVDAGDRGRTTAWMQAGMLVGRATFGGLSLAVERWVGAGTVVLILVGCVWITLIAVWLSPQARAREAARVDPTPLLRSLGQVLRRRSTWIGLGVALTAGAGFEAVGGLMGPYLVDRAASQEAIGAFFALPVVACMILGGLLGGWIADRTGHRRLVGLSVIVIGAAVGLIVAADVLLQARGWRLMAAATPLYLGIGALTAASYALFMDLSDPAVGGTQFSAFMGMTNLCEVWAVWLGGALVTAAGYGTAFLATAALSLASLGLLPLLGDRSDRGSGSSP